MYTIHYILYYILYIYIHILGDFYAELLRALVMEGDPWAAQDLLSLIGNTYSI